MQRMTLGIGRNPWPRPALSYKSIWGVRLVHPLHLKIAPELWYLRWGRGNNFIRNQLEFLTAISF